MRILFLLTLSLLSLSLRAQTFTLRDTTFKVGDKYITRAILFDYDKYSLRPDSYIHLDSIANFLTQHKELVNEVSNHCDTRYSNELSRCLTCKRAQAIADYFISKGIKSDRLIARGYNDDAPIIPESTIRKMKNKEEIEKAHQTNRRTELKILHTDYK